MNTNIEIYKSNQKDAHWNYMKFTNTPNTVTKHTK